MPLLVVYLGALCINSVFMKKSHSWCIKPTVLPCQSSRMVAAERNECELYIADSAYDIDVKWQNRQLAWNSVEMYDSRVYWLTQWRVRTVCCFKLISKHDTFPLKMLMYMIVPKRVYRLLCVYDCANENNVLMETMLQNGVASLLVQKSSIFSASYWIVEKIVKTKMWNYILDDMTIVLNGDVYLSMFYVLTIFVWKNGNTEKYRYAYAK